MPSLAAVASQVRAAQRPVLFLDTCVLLDVIRATMRCADEHVVPSAIELRNMLASDPAHCTLVLASIIPAEWNNHAERTRGEARKHFEQMQDHAHHFHEACRSLGVPLDFGAPSYPAVHLEDRLFSLASELVLRAIVLDLDDACAGRAVLRVSNNLPPSRKGGEMKDCVIFEECLELSRQLGSHGFAENRVFCTSNVNDYGRPHPALASDAAAVGVTIATSLPLAMRQLRARRAT